MQAIIRGTRVGVLYQEPTTNADGTPLLDLASTKIFYRLAGVEYEAATVPATSPNGGGQIDQTIDVQAAQGLEVSCEIWVKAFDDDGNESPTSEIQIVVIDRLAPAAPI